MVNGDFNYCSLKKTSVKYHQHVTCATRENVTLDMFYSNVKDAYTSIQLPKLGNADHNLVNLLPKYRPLVQRQKPKTIAIQEWNDDSLKHLQGSLECTDWDMFIEAASSLDELTDTISAYVNFFTDISIPVKHIKVFANNKPWITKNVKEIINRKKCIFGKGSAEELKGVNRELKRVIKQEKAKYKNKVEENFTENNMKRVWHGMKLMSGYSNGGKKSLSITENHGRIC